MNAPQFKPDVPAPLLKGASDRDRWMYETLSVTHQQNEWIMQRLADGESRFDQVEAAQAHTAAKVERLERFKTVLTAKSTVAVFVVSAILGPIGLALIGAALTRWFEKVWP